MNARLPVDPMNRHVFDSVRRHLRVALARGTWRRWRPLLAVARAWRRAPIPSDACKQHPSRRRRTMITEAEFRALAAQGYNRIPLVARVVRRPRHAAVAVPQARATSATRSCSSRSSAASASAAIRSSACRRRSRIRARGTRDRGRGSRRRRRAPRRRSARVRARRTCSASAPRRCRGCRASAAGSPAISATTPCATSSRGSRAARRRRRRALDDVPDMLLLLTDELAVVDNLAGQDLADRLRRSGEPDAYGDAQRAAAGAAPASCASR